MPRQPKPRISAKNIQGLKYFDRLQPLFAPLHDLGTERDRAGNRHLHFDVFKGVPCYATVTDGNGNEKKELRASLQAGRLYPIDRGYAEYQLFQDIMDAQSSFIGRIRDNADYQLIEERPLSDD